MVILEEDRKVSVRFGNSSFNHRDLVMNWTWMVKKKKKTENKDDSCISGSPKWMVGGVMP